MEVSLSERLRLLLSEEFFPRSRVRSFRREFLQLPWRFSFRFAVYRFGPKSNKQEGTAIFPDELCSSTLILVIPQAMLSLV